jgi:predicted transcriptional regulator
MSITLELPPQVETLLRQRAEATGQDIHHIAIAILTLGLSHNDEDFLATMAGIQQGLDDFEQGRFSSLEDFIAEQTEKHGVTLEA